MSSVQAPERYTWHFLFPGRIQRCFSFNWSQVLVKNPSAPDYYEAVKLPSQNGDRQNMAARIVGQQWLWKVDIDDLRSTLKINIRHQRSLVNFVIAVCLTVGGHLRIAGHLEFDYSALHRQHPRVWTSRTKVNYGEKTTKSLQLVQNLTTVIHRFVPFLPATKEKTNANGVYCIADH